MAKDTEHNLTKQFWDEQITSFLVVSLLLGTGGCAAVILV